MNVHITNEQDLKQITDAEESRKRGIPQGAPFKLMKRTFVLLSEQESKEAEQRARQEVPDVTGLRIH